jgi:hypothetical protein
MPNQFDLTLAEAELIDEHMLIARFVCLFDLSKPKLLVHATCVLLIGTD